MFTFEAVTKAHKPQHRGLGALYGEREARRGQCAFAAAVERGHIGHAAQAAEPERVQHASDESAGVEQQLDAQEQNTSMSRVRVENHYTKYSTCTSNIAKCTVQIHRKPILCSE